MRRKRLRGRRIRRQNHKKIFGIKEEKEGINKKTEKTRGKQIPPVIPPVPSSLAERPFFVIRMHPWRKWRRRRRRRDGGVERGANPLQRGRGEERTRATLHANNPPAVLSRLPPRRLSPKAFTARESGKKPDESDKMR